MATTSPSIRRIASCGSLREALALLAAEAVRRSEASGALVRLSEGREMAPRFLLHRGRETDPEAFPLPDGALAERVLSTGRPAARRLAVRRLSFLSVPVTASRMRIGVLTVFREGSSARAFGFKERESLLDLGREAALPLALVHDRETHQKDAILLEMRGKELSLLHRFARSILQAEDRTRILRTLLCSITHQEEGLGFDRAFFFALTEKGDLEGVLGVGSAETPAEEKREGTELADCDSLLVGRGTHAVIDHLVHGVRVPVAEGMGVLASAAREKRSHLVRMPYDRQLLDRELGKRMGLVGSFAVIPLVTESRVLGVVWVDNLVSGHPIHTADMRLLITLGTLAGLAEERAARSEALQRAHKETLELQERLIQFEKAAALGELLASVAHEIRNPLVLIGGFARRLQNLTEGETAAGRYAGIIAREVDRLEKTLADMLSFSREPRPLQGREVALNGLVTGCIGLLKQDLRRKKVRLRRILWRGGSTVVVDPGPIKQAVTNLLMNAIHAAGEGGEVTVRTFAARERYGKLFYTAISDNGGGIPPEVMGNIFNPFFTTKAGGTGLGLTIAQKAVLTHGGELRVDNRPGQGVTFTMVLPMSTGSREARRG